MKHFHFIKELKDFLLLWASQAISELGTAMTSYAMVIWVYGHKGTATSLTALTLCTFMPTILLRFIGGTLADRWDKRRIMLAADVFAACGTLMILVLYSFDVLRIWHLYIINVLLSGMNAVQAPASFAATSVLVPAKHYTRAGGLQGVSGATIYILSPALGSVLLVWGGIEMVLLFDLASFAVAFVTLLLFIRIPRQTAQKNTQGESFWQSCLVGVRYLKQNKAMLSITLFIAITNFLAKIGNDGMLAPFILARTGNNQQILGMVQSGVAIGLLLGSMLATAMKPVKKKTRLIFLLYAFIFSGNIVQGVSDQARVWFAAAVITYAAAAVMNANLTTVLREYMPVEVQGRVFSAKDTLQNCTIPLGLLLGGILADHLFEPLMMNQSGVLSAIFGTGGGAGLALMVCCAGVLGCIVSLVQLGNPVYRELDK